MISKLKKLSQNESFMRYFKNSSWMMAEYGLRFVSAIFVSIYVARYLGPDSFGILSYALAIVAVFMTIARLGMESILVRDLTQYPEKFYAYMGTAFGLMVAAAMVGSVLLGAFIYFLDSDFQTKLYILIISTGLFFQTFLVIDYAFQAQVKAKYSSISKSLALLVSSIIKIYLVWVEADLLAFALAFAFDHLSISVGLILTYLKQKQKNFVFAFDRGLVQKLIVSAWPMTLVALGSMLYLRTDQLMIYYYLDSYDLGVYSAISKFFEGWNMIPYVLSISLLPVILKLSKSDEYHKYLSFIYSLFIYSGIFVFLIFLFQSEALVLFFLGQDYLSGKDVLPILFFAAIFAAIATLNNRVILVEGKETDITKRILIAGVLNILLNAVLIPLYEIEGAAMSTLISFFYLAILANLNKHKALLKVILNGVFFNLNRVSMVWKK